MNPLLRLLGSASGRRVERWLLLPGIMVTTASIGHSELIVPKGLPLTRYYAHEEIGNVSSGVRLAFDGVGRLIVTYEGGFVVLNDDVWLDLSPAEPDAIRTLCLARDESGVIYYGALGSWGTMKQTDQGRLQAEPARVPDIPKWATIDRFTEVICRPEGIYFQGSKGVVFLDRTSRRSTFIGAPDVARLIFIGNEPYISSHQRGMLRLDIRSGSLLTVERETFGSRVVDHVANLPDGRAIVATTERQLSLFDGRKIQSLPKQWVDRLDGPVAALQTLSDGKVAVAITGKGLYIIFPDGALSTALTVPEYRQISSLATSEPGVLWAATESGIVKILYGAPVTTFGQALGLPVAWPQFVVWDEKTIIASNGRIYEPESVPENEPTRFRYMSGQPSAGGWGIAVFQDWLLIANAGGVFAKKPGLPFRPVLPGIDVSRLAMLQSGICLVIGEHEIAALHFTNDEWRECAPRVAGVGYPANVSPVGEACWIEVGANYTARIALNAGRIETRVFDEFPWEEPQWINVSIIGPTVILSGDKHGRIFFDEVTEALSDHSAVEKIIDGTPFRAARFRMDNTGMIWASHQRGVYTLLPQDGGYVADTTTYSFITERIPIIHFLPGPQIWMSTGRTLQQITPNYRAGLVPHFQPQLVSAQDLRTNRELLAESSPKLHNLFQLHYEENSLALRFFAGSYAFRRPPRYEFRLNSSEWNSLDASSLIRFSDLREGSYNLTVRLVEDRGPVGPEETITFIIAPPWFRAWYAYLVYALIAGFAIVGLLRFLLRRSRARNAELERIVAERTAQLTATMQKLERETRTAATLAERNRLASEIHDSLEQGFSALLFQLETLQTLTGCPPAIQSGLSIARNMVNFSRNEIRHVVWDLHSQFLDTGSLESALHRIIAQITPDPSRAKVRVEGTIRALGSTVEHHLLRIAQEAVANSAKHASADHLDVHLVFSGDTVRLCITDDGRGFDPKRIMTQLNGHFGIRSLRGRAAKIGGTLDIVSQPGSGTSVTVVLPLPALSTV